DGRRQLAQLRWGLIPAWADDPAIGNRLINARAETAADKPSFRAAFRQRRCLIPATGYYEWMPGERRKPPYFIGAADGRPPTFAGLGEHWTKGEEPVESFAILTTEANEIMRPLHERMPVVVAAADFDGWLRDGDPALLRPCPAE